MPDLVFELGTEEMPANAVASALSQLQSALADRLLPDARLTAESVEVMGTPRRLIAICKGVPAVQPDEELVVRGPAKTIAFDAGGKPTGAATGFAKKQGIAPESLELIQTDQGEYVQARVFQAGRPAVDVLGGVLSDAITGLTFPKMMRWGDGGMRYVRPIRWIVALLDDLVVPMELAGVASGRKSRGHRTLAPGEFDLGKGQDLVPRLREAQVFVDPSERESMIRQQADALAAEAGGRVVWSESLLDENVWLVERPTVLLGRISEDFLELPRPVLVTAMMKHQRFFPVEDNQGKLLPCFISVRNGGEDHLDVVREGNVRVLSARFADARHFYLQDRDTPLDDLVSGLNRLMFQEKLGTMDQKRQRLELLIQSVCQQQTETEIDTAVAIRAARLAKADLVSKMVIELPALQGIIGKEYALQAGEDPRVAGAIAEHYLPRFAGDDLPGSTLGALLAAIDRIDTLTGYLGLGIQPSGSSDPFGLRRAAQGAVQIMASQDAFLPVEQLIRHTLQAYQTVNQLEFDAETTVDSLLQLLQVRAQVVLEASGTPPTLAEAALGVGLSSETLYSLTLRAEALQSAGETPEFTETVLAASRAANLLKSQAAKGSDKPTGSTGIRAALAHIDSLARHIEPVLFVHETEHALFDRAYLVMPELEQACQANDFTHALKHVQSMNTAVNNLFDSVMILDNDAAVRANRLSLLQYVDALYGRVAKFSCIEA